VNRSIRSAVIGAGVVSVAGVVATAVAPTHLWSAAFFDVALAGSALTWIRQARSNQQLVRAANAASERVASVLAHTVDAVIFTSPDGEVLEWNRAAERLFGIPRERALGTNALRQFSETNRDAITEAVVSGGLNGTDVTVPVEIGGRTVPVTLSVEAVMDGSGKLAGFVTVARDDTDRVVARHARRTFAQLDPDEALMRFAEDLSGIVPFEVLSLSSVEGDDLRELARVGRDSHGEFRVVERDGLITGRLADIGYTFTDDPYVIVTPDDISAYADPVQALDAQGIIALPLRRHDRTLRGFLSLSFSDPTHATPAYANALARVATDVAQSVENMLLFEEQQLYADHLLELNEMRDAFLAMVAHEVRAPLSAIGSAAVVLRDRRYRMTPQQTQDMLDGIATSAEHMARLSSDLIDAGRTGEGRFPCHMRSIQDFGELVIAAAEATGADNDHRIDVSVAHGVALRGDADRLKQIVGNLVSNACKFSEDPVAVTMSATRDCAVVRVADRGPGVPHDQAERIFERFTRLGAGPGQPRGTGLGLYIARELAHAHGGDITLAPTPGGGATFELHLPL
jgi:PAS domain S-box-containing protein